MFHQTIFIVLGLFHQAWSSCLPTIPLVLDDIHDGDQKQIKSIEWDTFMIRPYPNTSEWIVEGKFDINCVAIVDFNVSGKPDYPPVPLKMAMWVMQMDAIPSAVKLGFEFTDPSETLAPRTQPLNFWTSTVLGSEVELPSSFSAKTKQNQHVQSETCIYTPHGEPIIFNDMLIGDAKGVVVEDVNITIKPDNDKETWTVESTFTEGCVAMVNFDVPGYPNPPDAPQELAIWEMAAISGAEKDAMVYTKPSDGAPLGSPLNLWVPSNEEKN